MRLVLCLLLAFRDATCYCLQPPLVRTLLLAVRTVPRTFLSYTTYRFTTTTTMCMYGTCEVLSAQVIGSSSFGQSSAHHHRFTQSVSLPLIEMTAQLQLYQALDRVCL